MILDIPHQKLDFRSSMLVPSGPQMDEDEFQKLEVVNTQAATPSSITKLKILDNLKRNLPTLHGMPEFKQIKSEPIALIGGGPSVSNYIEEIKGFKYTIACGSAHDFCVKNNIIPTYATACDPDPITANYLTKPQIWTKYLIASGCDKKVFDYLKGFSTYIWHCHSDDYMDMRAQMGGEYQAVGGGCTVGLRSLSIALMLGYWDIHFYGFDSCMGDNLEHHAYDFSDETEEIGQIYTVRFGNEKNSFKEKDYKCAGYQLAQASHFKEFYSQYCNVFKPTFHGDGLLPAMVRHIQNEEARLGLSKTNQMENLRGLLSQPEGTKI
jgi:hypothetical protein